jgi:hypothetical protein
MILTAHQANFFPYAGVFEKIAASDVFVMLTQVQFTRNNYHNRFQYRDRWYTMPVNQKLEPLSHKFYENTTRSWESIKRKLPAYGDLLDQFDDVFRVPTCSLTGANGAIIGRILDRLKMDTKPTVDGQGHGTATMRLINLCKAHGADVYLSGPSGRNYLDEPLFEQNGIELRYFTPTDKRAAIELLREVS